MIAQLTFKQWFHLNPVLNIIIGVALFWVIPCVSFANEDFCSFSCDQAEVLQEKPSLKANEGVQVHINQGYVRPASKSRPSTTTLENGSPASLLESQEIKRSHGITTTGGTPATAGAAAGAKPSIPGIQPRQPRGPRQGRQPRIKFSPRA